MIFTIYDFSTELTDFLYVYDGDSNSSSLLWSLSGRYHISPIRFVFFGNQATIHFNQSVPFTDVETYISLNYTRIQGLILTIGDMSQ